MADKTYDYKTIDATAARNQVLRDRALQAEVQATTDEIALEQFSKALEQDVPGTEGQVQNLDTAATQSRERANGLHKLAGTTPQTFAQQVSEHLTQQRQAHEYALVQQELAAEHPDLFQQDPEQAATGLRLTLLGLEALDERVRKIGPARDA